MRLFIGLELPQDIKDYLDVCYENIKTPRKGWELSHDYHLTLLFIGETTPEVAQEIIQRMSKIKAEAFELKLSGPEFFPRRILYQSFYPSEPLVRLKDKVEDEFSEWLQPGARPFKAHATIKRYQRYEHEELLQRIGLNPYGPRTFRVSDLALFKSEKNSENQRYHVIYREKLV